MLRKLLLFPIIMISLAVSLTACGQNAPPVKSTGQIYLYGEQHGEQAIMERQLELWSECYHSTNMRHLFVELPYYTAEFLNIWIRSDSDYILDELYIDWAGTAICVPYTKVFYRTIKSDCPETVFHGTDVGHQYDTSGERFLKYLEDSNLKDSEQYRLAQATMEQGRYYYGNASDLAYRVIAQTENFIREFDQLADRNVMGIYGAAHTAFGRMAPLSFDTMAERLKKRYGDSVHAENLSQLAAGTAPLRTDVIHAGGKDYEASYFGEQDLTGFGIDFTSRAFWRLENAYDDFKDNPATGDVLPYNNYPMPVETGQVFVIGYAKPDGSVIRMYYRSDGNTWKGSPATEGFTVPY